MFNFSTCKCDLRDMGQLRSLSCVPNTLYLSLYIPFGQCNSQLTNMRKPVSASDWMFPIPTNNNLLYSWGTNEGLINTYLHTKKSITMYQSFIPYLFHRYM